MVIDYNPNTLKHFNIVVYNIYNSYLVQMTGFYKSKVVIHSHTCNPQGSAKLMRRTLWTGVLTTLQVKPKIKYYINKL